MNEFAKAPVIVNLMKKQIALLESLLCSFTYSAKVVLASAVAVSLGGFTLAWTSTALGGALLGIYVFIIKRLYLPARLPLKIWVYIALAGILRSISPAFQFMALEKITGTTLNFLFNFVGVATILFSIIINREKPTRFQLIGTVIMILGLQIFFDKKPTLDEFTGVFLVVLSIISIGLMNAISRELNKLMDNWTKENPGVKVSSLSVVAASILIGATMLFIIGLVVDLPLPVFTTKDYIVLLITAIIGLTVTSVVWYDLLGRWEAYKASLLSSASVFWTLVLSVIFLNQPVYWFQVLGIIIMFVGLAFILFSYKASNKAPTLLA